MTPNSAFGLLIVACGCIVITESTICRPDSLFKVDCNLCQCDSSGKRYTCTEKRCPPKNYEDFVIEIDKDQRVVLKPKPTPTLKKFDLDDEFLFSRKFDLSNMFHPLGLRKDMGVVENSAEKNNEKRNTNDIYI
ncbi:uncharacterized protein LOC132703301 [Cylas formicarius]|uniref:uncharacterized protein LOC132703301 n=1 Tax=Cylas formicarius TaxID=197179 RepID=UPI002958D433|nr:uncharacterized protein LOC132703301 [Cylas formicarius]